jgi:Mrp family chromosome partitioning ATPase
VASGNLADGKTTVTANTAFAAARGGSKVALVDADFANPALTQLLMPGAGDVAGLTDLARGDADLAGISHQITWAGGDTVTLFTRGRYGTEMPDFFATSGAENLIAELESRFDLVLIDAPPVLRLAYSGAVVRLAQRVLVVVAHKSNIAFAQDLERYLSVVGVPVLGYVYNFAPLRRELLNRGGSTGYGKPDGG